MSTTVDQRVVEMRFDNKQFESNVSNTMSTLDKLKQKLNLTGAAKGLENVSTAAKGVNMLGLGSAVEAVQAKFSALQVVGVTALANITNSAVNTGKRMISALTIDPIKTGLSEYETQINAVQTILANTESKGTTLGQVNSALDELNTYADKTIYNFTEMTRNIGTFTAAGVDLRTSVNAIQGIANLAAVSGSNSQQASTAMYQLSQALASGTVKLMDWNSVVNAGMGGQVFQDALKTTSKRMAENAESLKKMSEAQRQAYQETHGYTDDQMKSMMNYTHNVDQLIEKNGSFRESLQAGWITSEVLTETLSHFTMAAEEGSETWLKYKKSLMDSGYTEEQAESILKLSNTATDAATKVKTATQLWDTLKETAQSGWTQTWEIILGDFGEAKELFSGIYETLSPMIDNMSKARNELLSAGLSSGWKQLMGEGIADEEGYRASVKTIVKEHGVAIDEMISKEKELDSSLSDSDAFQKVLKKGLEDGSISSDMLSESVTHLADKMRNMSDAERDAAGYTKEHVTQIEDLEKKLKSGEISMDEFVKKMTRPSGRENLIQSLLNAFNGLMSVVAPIKEAFSDIFPAVTGEQVYQLTERIKKFSENLTLSSEVASKVKRIFKGVFSIFDIGRKAIGSIAEAFLGLAKSDGISTLATFLLDTAAALGDFFTNLNEKFDTDGLSGLLSGAVSGISNFLGIATGKIETFGDVLGTVGKFISEVAVNIWDGLKVAFEWFSENFSAADIFAGLAGGGIVVAAKKLIGFIDSIKEAFEGLFGKGEGGGVGSIKEKFSELLDGVGETLQSFTTSVKTGSFVAIAAAIAILASAFQKISTLDAVDISKSLVTMGIALGIMMKALNSMPTNTKFGSGFKKFFSSGFINFSESTNLIKSGAALILLAKSIGILSDAMIKLSGLSWEEIAKGLIGVGGGIAALCGGLKLLNGTKVSMGTSLAMLALAEACKILGDAMTKFVGFSWGEIARGLAGMGGALGELVAALAILSKVGGFGSLLGSIGILITVQSLGEMAEGLKSFSEMAWDEIGRGLAAMGGALGEVAIITGALGKLAGFSSIFAAGSIYIITQGLTDMASALTSFGEMSWDEIGRGLAAMGGALAELMYTLTAIGTIAGFSSIFAAGSVFIVTQGLSDMASALKSFGEMSWDGIGKGLAAMGGALAELTYTLIAVGTLAGFSSIFASGAILITIQGLGDMANALKSFGEMSWDEIGRGLVAMGGALAEVAVVAGVLGTLAGLPALLGGGGILLAVQGLGDLADALKKFGEMSWDEIGRGLTAMGAALGEVALGSLLNIFSGLGASAISEMAAPLGVLADSVKKWSGVTVPEGLGDSMSALASGVKSFTFGGLGAGALAEAAPAVGTMADSIKKWTGVTVPENLGTSLSTLATGVKSFTFGGLGAGALTEAASGIGAMADSVKKWSGVVVPEGLGANLQSLGAGVKSFTFGGLGADALTEAAPGMGSMADSVKKWSGVVVPEGLGTNLSSLATGVKAFTFGGSGAGSLTEAAPGVGAMADSIKKWVGVTIPEGLVENLGILADGVKKFTLGGFGADTIATCATGLGTMADSVKKWTGVTVPENLGTNLSTLAAGVKEFTFGGSGAETLSIAATGVGEMATAVTKWSGVTIPENLSTNLSSLADAVKKFSGLDDISSTVTSIGNLATESNTLAGVNYSGITSGLTSFADAITNFSSVKSSLSGLGASITNELVTPLKNASKDLSGVGSDMINSIANGLQSGKGSSSSAGTDAASSVINSIKSKTDEFTKVGQEFTAKLANGIKSKHGTVKDAATTAAANAASGARSGYSGMYDAGVYLGQGLVNGLNAMYSTIVATAEAVGAAAADAANTGAGSASPSKKTTQTGIWLGQGLVNGMNSMGRAVAKAGYAMGDDAARTVSSAVSRISDAINIDIDSQPTIRPVLDLSDVRAGASTIGSMLNTNPLSVMTSIGAISSSINRRGQNGAENEVVSAITKLRRDLANMPRESYNINGVTYDDGSNIKSFAEAVVHQARLERRV